MTDTKQNIGAELCKALGLESRQVIGLTLRVQPNDLVVAEVEYVPTEEQMAAAITVLRNHPEGVKITNKPAAPQMADTTYGCSEHHYTGCPNCR